MAKINFSKLGLKVNQEVKTVTINDTEIEVKQHLPAAEQLTLINNTVEKAFEKDIYEDFNLDVFFALNIVYNYTNLTFTDKQKEDEYKLYDILESNGVIDAIVAAIPEEEYTSLFEYIETKVNGRISEQHGIVESVKKILSELPKEMDRLTNLLGEFNPSQYQQVIDFANAANGGRNFITNEPIE